MYIFAQNQPTMLEDSLQIANTFDFEMSTEVYKLYAQHLIEKGYLIFKHFVTSHFFFKLKVFVFQRIQRRTVLPGR